MVDSDKVRNYKSWKYLPDFIVDAIIDKEGRSQ